MKKILCLILALVMVLGLAACGGSKPAEETKPAEATKPADTGAQPAEEEEEEEDVDYSGYTIRIYSNSNSTERVTWLVNEAREAGFTISLDTNETISGDTAAVQAANENKDGDLIFGLNETRWTQLINGQYENLTIADWTPSWADEVGNYVFPGKAYGLVVQNVLMLYRDDEFGTNGQKLHFQHWADVIDSGYTWYRQGKVGGTTNANLNSAMLFPYVDPASPAGGISIDGWKTLWAYCAGGNFTGDSYGFDPLNRGDVQIGSFYSSSLYSKVDAAAESSEHPLIGTLEPENWGVVDIDDGTFYIAEYLGILDRPGRTAEETAAVEAFAEWFGSAELQAAWSEEFDSFPCNEVAVDEVFGDDIPNLYTLRNFALDKVDGDTNYATYVINHSAVWTNIMTNLGFYWADQGAAPAEPDWDNLDWATLTQSAG
ncbi:MAG: extracellular solute-binding protein [Oscillospiraceae bacterium]|nr:extracellular solute-binding protein [Oscillospiraceae bacterium]